MAFRDYRPVESMAKYARTEFKRYFNFWRYSWSSMGYRLGIGSVFAFPNQKISGNAKSLSHFGDHLKGL